MASTVLEKTLLHLNWDAITISQPPSGLVGFCPLMTDSRPRNINETHGFIFPEPAVLEEFRIHPTGSWPPSGSIVEIRLLLEDTPIVQHQILSGDGDRQSPKKFDIGGLFGLSVVAGERILCEGVARGGSGTHFYEFQLWGRWTRT